MGLPPTGLPGLPGVGFTGMPPLPGFAPMRPQSDYFIPRSPSPIPRYRIIPSERDSDYRHRDDGSVGRVVFVKNLKEGQFTPVKLRALFSNYGDVLKVCLLFSLTQALARFFFVFLGIF